MQEHEKILLTLIVIGGLIGMSKLLVSPEKLTFRVEGLSNLAYLQFL
ncbi:phage holin family protein [Acinetobacter guillouiae]|nr:phage holin family protein [Acinetobacter guillouiae]MCU4492632.1 phage holin family protein [Acinetobacter guillouiae]